MKSQREWLFVLNNLRAPINIIFLSNTTVKSSYWDVKLEEQTVRQLRKSENVSSKEKSKEYRNCNRN